MPLCDVKMQRPHIVLLGRREFKSCSCTHCHTPSRNLVEEIGILMPVRKDTAGGGVLTRRQMHSGERTRKPPHPQFTDINEKPLGATSRGSNRLNLRQSYQRDRSTRLSEPISRTNRIRGYLCRRDTTVSTV